MRKTDWYSIRSLIIMTPQNDIQIKIFHKDSVIIFGLMFKITSKMGHLGSFGSINRFASDKKKTQSNILRINQWTYKTKIK